MCGNVTYDSGQVSNNTCPQMSVYAADCLYLFYVTRFLRYAIILFCHLLCRMLQIRLFHLVYKQLNCVNIPWCFFFFYFLLLFGIIHYIFRLNSYEQGCVDFLVKYLENTFNYNP